MSFRQPKITSGQFGNLMLTSFSELLLGGTKIFQHCRKKIEKKNITPNITFVILGLPELWALPIKYALFKVSKLIFCVILI